MELTQMNVLDIPCISESYLVVKGAALILPRSECATTITRDSPRGEVQFHLQSMCCLLRSQDKLKAAVKLETRSSLPNYNRYMALVSTIGTQDQEESVILGIDIVEEKATIGLVLPIWSDLIIRLDGDGGYIVITNDKQHIFKPVSVQVMWSSLQCVSKFRDIASQNNYIPSGLTHTWLTYYESLVNSDQSCISEWHFMDEIESHKPNIVPDSDNSKTATLKRAMVTKLRQMALTVDFEEVSSKDLRKRLEDELHCNLEDFRFFIDEQIIIIFRQMESPSKIFDYLYLGTEWNAGNLTELRNKGIGYILNVAKEVDNFYLGALEYKHVKVHDTEEADLLKHWGDTYEFISKAKNNNSKVLVHCKMGVSRSASTVVAFAMKENNWSRDQALTYVQERRSCVQPNAGFMRQLETYEGILDASKQRHNTLWTPVYTGHPAKTSARGLNETCSSKFGNDQMDDGDQPLSSTPNSSSALLMSQNLVLEYSLVADIDAETESDVNQNDTTDDFRFFNLPSDAMMNWLACETSSQSNSQDDLLGFQLNLPLDSLDDTFAGGKATASSSQITLLTYKKIDPDNRVGLEPLPLLPDENGDSDSDEATPLDDQNGRQEGFYDLNMLAGYRRSPEEDDEEDAFLSSEDCPLLHPDMVLETAQAIQRKRRQVAKMLERSQELERADSDGKDADDGDPHENGLRTNGQGSENGKIAMTLTKVRPDNYWIKESPDESPSASSSAASQDGSKLDQFKGEVSVINRDLQQQLDTCVSASTDSSNNSNHQSECTCSCSLRSKELDFTIKTCQPEECCVGAADLITGGNDLTSESCSAHSSGTSSDFGTDVSKLTPNGCVMVCSRKRANVKLEGTSQDESGNLQTGVVDLILSRPISIYESEDILLEPGIVQKTKREIELRERSISTVDLSCECDGKPVQRSSSCKLERRLDRPKSKDRNSERRRTCLPVYMPSPPSADGSVTFSIRQELELYDQRNYEGDSCLRLDVQQGNSRVDLRDELEMTRGIVKRTTKGFEEGIPQLTFSGDETPDSLSVSAPDEIPVETGMVRRQTNQLEKRYGRSSPQSASRGSSELNPDLTKPEESNISPIAKLGFEHVELEKHSTRQAADEKATTVLTDVLAGSGKASSAQRDENHLRLSLSQKCLTSTSQSFGSPVQARKNFISAPSDFTQKEMNSRKACSPQKEQNITHGSVFLSEGEFDNSSDISEKDLGCFSRTLSYRETPSKNKDIDAKFSRSHSLRLRQSSSLHAQPVQNSILSKTSQMQTQSLSANISPLYSRQLLKDVSDTDVKVKLKTGSNSESASLLPSSSEKVKDFSPITDKQFPPARPDSLPIRSSKVINSNQRSKMQLTEITTPSSNVSLALASPLNASSQTTMPSLPISETVVTPSTISQIFVPSSAKGLNSETANSQTGLTHVSKSEHQPGESLPLQHVVGTTSGIMTCTSTASTQSQKSPLTTGKTIISAENLSTAASASDKSVLNSESNVAVSKLKLLPVIDTASEDSGKAVVTSYLKIQVADKKEKTCGKVVCAFPNKIDRTAPGSTQESDMTCLAKQVKSSSPDVQKTSQCSTGSETVAAMAASTCSSFPSPSTCEVSENLPMQNNERSRVVKHELPAEKVELAAVKESQEPGLNSTNQKFTACQRRNHAVESLNFKVTDRMKRSQSSDRITNRSMSRFSENNLTGSVRSIVDELNNPRNSASQGFERHSIGSTLCRTGILFDADKEITSEKSMSIPKIPPADSKSIQNEGSCTSLCQNSGKSLKSATNRFSRSYSDALKVVETAKEETVRPSDRLTSHQLGHGSLDQQELPCNKSVHKKTGCEKIDRLKTSGMENLPYDNLGTVTNAQDGEVKRDMNVITKGLDSAQHSGKTVKLEIGLSTDQPTTLPCQPAFELDTSQIPLGTSSKKLYGKSHPLSRLSSEVTINSCPSCFVHICICSKPNKC